MTNKYIKRQKSNKTKREKLKRTLILDETKSVRDERFLTTKNTRRWQDNVQSTTKDNL